MCCGPIKKDPCNDPCDPCKSKRIKDPIVKQRVSRNIQELREMLFRLTKIRSV